MKPDGKKAKAKVPQAPITQRNPQAKLARTMMNKLRRIAKDTKLKQKHGRMYGVPHVQGQNVNWQGDMPIYHLSRMLKERAKHKVSQKHEHKVEHVKLIKTQYSIEARARLV